MTLVIAYKSKIGGWTIYKISPSELELQLQKPKRRMETIAWIDGHRDCEVGWVFKNEGRWVYSLDGEIAKAEGGKP